MNMTSLVGGSERSVERRREPMVKAVEKGLRVKVGLQYERSLFCFDAPSVLCA